MGAVSSFASNVFGGGVADAARGGGALQAAAAGRGIDEITASREEALGFLSPFQGVGQQGIESAGFLTDPNAQFDFLQSNPLFKSALENANVQTQQQAASRGRSSAGDTLQQLSQNVLLSASPLIQGQKSSIMDLLNVGTNVAGRQAGVTTQAGGNIADLIGSQAAATAAGNVGAANAQAQGSQNLLTTALTAGAIFSDERLKSNVRLITNMNGHNIYSWVWNGLAKALFGLDGSSFGVLAQEVARTHPDAVVRDRGYMKVNYSMIGVPRAN